MSDESTQLEAQIGHWRAYLQRRQAIHAVDVAELEDHLRGQVASLAESGLSADEAFLVAVKRMGSLDALSREFATEHSERLWKQLVVAAPDEADAAEGAARYEAAVAIGLAVGAAAAIKVPELFGLSLAGGEDAPFYARNISFFVLPLLAGYFAWKRGLDRVGRVWLVVAFVAGVLFANAYPFEPGGTTEVLGATEVLTILHLPIALWLAVGVAYVGGRWRDGDRRMDFVRFSGELFIYYALMGLGGIVLIGVTAGTFNAIEIDIEPALESWILPCGALGAVIIGAWLVEAKQNVIENMAPVLTRLFTPMFTLVLLVFLGTMVATASWIDVEREVLITFDLLLALVLGLLLYSVSARDPQAPPNLFDSLQLVLVLSALVVDVVALVAIALRISEFGFSANKVAALGENLVLLVNLGWSAWLYARFLRGQGAFAALERWQTDYLPVYGAWVAFVVIAFPPLFGYV